MAGNNSSNSVGTRSSSRRFHNSSNSQQFCVVGGSILSTPTCKCGKLCVLRTAKTLANYERNFWGCRNYKGPHDVGCNYFDWFDNEEVNGKEACAEDFDSKIEKIEMLLDEKKLKIKEYEVKVQDKDMKLAKQKKKIKKMKEEILSARKMLKLVCVGCFVCLCLIVVLVAMIWAILAG
ncbi:Class II abasic (AP) endonuclease [Trifolium repens]|nr:Class II abasic (AP) endonuclease [Trifolium repens]